MVLIAVVWQELVLDNPYATHLLRELLQDCTMDMDTTMERVSLITSSNDIKTLSTLPYLLILKF